jgi:hypothetical protein
MIVVSTPATYFFTIMTQLVEHKLINCLPVLRQDLSLISYDIMRRVRGVLGVERHNPPILNVHLHGFIALRGSVPRALGLCRSAIVDGLMPRQPLSGSREAVQRHHG